MCQRLTLWLLSAIFGLEKEFWGIIFFDEKQKPIPNWCVDRAISYVLFHKRILISISISTSL